jgi:hypothetical protein
MPPTTPREVELWTGDWVRCEGFRDGLPWWRYGDAPKGLVTKTQLWEQKLRRRRGQDPVALLIFRKRGCGEVVSELFRIDLALPSRPMSPRWAASIQAMQRAHRTCVDCGRLFHRPLPTSTWSCCGDADERSAPGRRCTKRPRKPSQPAVAA